MNESMTVTEISQKAAEISRAKPQRMTKDEINDFYFGRLLMADFLLTQGIPLRDKRHPDVPLDGGQFSTRYRRLAAEQGVADAFVRSATGCLLWSAEFLCDNLETVKERIIADIQVQYFGES